LDAWYNRGRAYIDLHQYDKALADYSKAIELMPNHPTPLNNRGVAYSQMGRHHKALADFSKAIELDPKNSAIWNNRGWAYLLLHQEEKALADFSKAIELDPNDATTWNLRGDAYAALQQWDKAIADWSKLLELDPKNAEAWNKRGVTYSFICEWNKALADCSKALDLQAKAPIFQNNLAWLLCTRSEPNRCDPQRAVALAEKAVQAAPKEGNCGVTLGVARYRAGDWKGAALALEEALKLLQATGGFQRGVGRSLFFLAMAQKQLGQGTDGQQTYHRALAWLEANQQTVQATPWLAAELRRFQAEAEELLKGRPEKMEWPRPNAPAR
jgi:tetratricopeptide (TPR) repeat protein